MDAIAGLLMLHVLPVVMLLSVTLEPTQTVPGPVIGAGKGFTVRDRVDEHPEPMV
jgi:hypothetical protein